MTDKDKPSKEIRCESSVKSNKALWSCFVSAGSMKLYHWLNKVKADRNQSTESTILLGFLLKNVCNNAIKYSPLKRLTKKLTALPPKVLEQ